MTSGQAGSRFWHLSFFDGPDPMPGVPPLPVSLISSSLMGFGHLGAISVAQVELSCRPEGYTATVTVDVSDYNPYSLCQPVDLFLPSLHASSLVYRSLHTQHLHAPFRVRTFQAQAQLSTIEPDEHSLLDKKPFCCENTVVGVNRIRKGDSNRL